MLRRASSIITLVAVLFSCGGHWAVLQGVAWTRMLVDFSRHAPLCQAVEMTLSGQHPCALCKKIAQEKGKEQRQEVTMPAIKKDWLDAQPVAALKSAAPGRRIFWSHEHCVARREAPLTRPPRSA